MPYNNILYKGIGECDMKRIYKVSENEFVESLLMLKALCGHVYTKEMVLNQCDKFGFRSYNVCVNLYKKGYWNETRRN